jgi:FkbM family methyltransferase
VARAPTAQRVGTEATVPYPVEGHHPVFSGFRSWEGIVEGGRDVNWLGVKTRASYYDVFTIPDEERHVSVPPLPFDEEYFEWIDLLEAVTGAQGTFTMLELGAGWGRWIVNAAAALHQRGIDDYKLIAVEAEPQHFRWLRQHVADNGLEARKVELIRAAVAGLDGTARFEVGDSSSYYGQMLVEVDSGISARLARVIGPLNDKTELSERGSRLGRVKAISLESLLRNLTVVDLIDADLQGAEADVFEPAARVLDEKVRRVHIETHDHEVEPRLRELFAKLAWEAVWDFPCAGDSTTPFGRVHFEGGVQTWVNPKL